MALCRTKRITDFSVVENLYKSRLKKDFVRNELKPLSAIRRAWERDAYECYGLFSGEDMLGYAFFVRLGRNYLFDYLAIAKDHRDEGLGSVFLRQLASCLSSADFVVGEVEDPDKAANEEIRKQRERRLRFYLRNGYEMPELTSVVFGADYRILEVPTGKTHSTNELRTVYTEIYRSIFSPIIFRTQFRVS